MHFAGINSKFQGALIEKTFANHCYKSVTRRNKHLENKVHLLTKYLLSNTCLPGATVDQVNKLLLRHKVLIHVGQTEYSRALCQRMHLFQHNLIYLYSLGLETVI